MGKAFLPPGFRFHPTDAELIMYYLKRKILGRKFHFEAISEINIYQFSPWDLPDMSCLKSKDLEWFFFCPREKKYASGVRVRRATENGYWKTTGKGRPISYNGEVVGMVKTLVFHLGHSPNGTRTDWVIHEYKIVDKDLGSGDLLETYTLCKVFKKSGFGPKNGAQYGAPFNEDDWPDDCEPIKNHAPILEIQVPKSQDLPSSSVGNLSNEAPAILSDEEIARMLAHFSADPVLSADDGAANQDTHSKGKKPLPSSDGFDVYDVLVDLGIHSQLDHDNRDFSDMYCNNSWMEKSIPMGYIELDDLMEPVALSDEGLFGWDENIAFQHFNPMDHLPSHLLPMPGEPPVVENDLGLPPHASIPSTSGQAEFLTATNTLWDSQKPP